MRGAPRLPDARAGTSMHLRVPGSLLQPAAAALVARLSLTAGLRAPAGRSLTLPPLHEIGTTPVEVPLPPFYGLVGSSLRTCDEGGEVWNRRQQIVVRGCQQPRSGS